MRWLILADDWPPQLGGVATWGFEHARGLVEEGHEVRVFARHRAGLLAPPGAEVTGVRGPSFGRHGGWWAGLRALPSLAWADRILCTTWTVAAGIAGRVSLPFEVVFHGSDATRPPLDEGTFERVMAHADRIWAVSHFLVGVLADRGYAAEHIATRVQPVEPGCDPNGPWIFVGRATPLKGGDRFVRLCAAAGKEGWLVGEGTALEEWRALAHALAAPVRFLGALDRAETLRTMARGSTLVLLPRTHPDGSGAEGLGLVLLEARAAGLQVVGCRTGGVPEALGPDGLCLEDPDDVAAALRALGLPAGPGATTP